MSKKIDKYKYKDNDNDKDKDILRTPPKTRNKMRVVIESGKGVKVKVVKLC